jgi:predicted porin
MKKQYLIKKSLLAVAAIAAMSAGSAMADVTVFGIMDVGVTSTKSVGSTTGRTTSMASGGMTTSAIGFKGSEAIDGGIKADFALSSFINLGNGSVLGGDSAPAAMFGREAWVGLGNDMGHISLGRDINPSFLPTILFNAYGDSTTFSPLWHATYFDYTTAINAGSASNGMINDTAWDNQIRYTTPNIGGAQADFSYALNKDGSKNSGANVMYFAGPVAVSAYVMRTEIGSYGGTLGTTTYGAGRASDTYFVGASYDAGVAKLFATYQDAKQKVAGQEAKTYQVSAAIPAGPGKVLVEFASTKYDATTDLTFKQTAVGYDLPLSKRTDVYANYLMSTKTAATNGNVFGVGIRHSF